MATGNVTQKDIVRAQTTQKAEKKANEYNAVQDWFCTIGEPKASLIVAGILGALVVAIAITCKILL